MKLIFAVLFLAAFSLNAFSEELAESGPTIEDLPAVDDADLTNPNFPENVPGGVNNQFKYDDKCKVALKSAVDSYKRESKLGQLTTELDLSAEELDIQSKLITDSDEKDLGFRMQVMGAANTSAQSILYSLRKIRELNPTLAGKLTATCEFHRVPEVIQWSDRLINFLIFAESVSSEE